MSNISWLYKNKCVNASKIVDIVGTNNITDHGSSFAMDYNLQSEWRSNAINATLDFRFDFGSSVYVDSLLVVHNLNSGTMYFNAGNTYPPSTISYGMPLLGNTGTSMNYLANAVNYRYWSLIADGTKLNDVIKLKEIFIGKRDELSVNPEYPFEKELNVTTIVPQSEAGHKFTYKKYDKLRYNFKYNGIDSNTFGTLSLIRDLCSGSYKPFWMCIDKDYNKFDTKMFRIVKGSWKVQEVIHNVYDCSFSVEEEL